ncbi:MAG: hypothetical protein ABIL68_14545 [bacterium]
MMGRLFRAAGADWDQFKALLSVSVRIDFRGRSETGSRRRRISPIFRSFIFYGLMGGSLSVTLAPKATLFLYSLLTLTYSMVMMAFAVILEFGNTIIHPDDAEILMHRPIRSRTYFFAKLANLLFYVSLMGTALCFLPSVVGVAVQGSGWTFPFVFFSVALIANMATASFIVLIYTGLLKVLQYHRFKDVLAYLQIGLTFIIFFLYQLIPRMGQRFFREGTDVTGKWLFAAPSAWFAGAVQVLLGMGRKGDASLAGIAVFTTMFLLLFAFRRISLQYAGLVAQVHTGRERLEKDRTRTRVSKGRRDSVLARLAGWIFPSSEFLAGFQLISTMLKRDRFVKMGIYPILGFPLAFLLLAIVQGDFKDPFIEGSITSGSSFSSMFVFFIFFMIYQSLMTLVTSREWDAAWIFIAAPIVSPGRFYLGVMMSVLVRLVIPFFLLLGVVACTQIPVVHAIKYTISLFLYGLVAFSVGAFLLKEYPFSRKRERGERMQRFSFLLFVAPFFIVTYALQIVTTRSMLLWWTTQGVLLILFFILESLGIRRLDRILKTKEFFV